MRLLATAVCATCFIALPVSAQVVTRTEHFDTNPGWSTLNSGVQGNLFGFSSTTNAGGATGEAGGHFTRSNTFRYYADTALGGSLTLNQPLTASGRFDYTASTLPDFVNGVFIGHFLSSPENYVIGIYFTNGGSDPNKLAWGINVRGDGDNVISSATSIDANVDRTWNYAWNPTGGVSGLGQFTATLSGPGGGTKTVDMPAGSTVRGAAVFTGFGLMGTNVLATPNSGEFADMFMDDVTYAIAVPEPSSFALATLAIALAAVHRLRRKLRGQIDRVSSTINSPSVVN